MISNNKAIIFERLSQSKFRSSFHLHSKEIEYIKNKGMTIIERHAYDFVNTRLAPSKIPNDGKQTPMKGHPVFIAQHATATCCRNCLYKWHHITPNHNLTKEEIDYIVNIIMLWINKELSTQNNRNMNVL